MSYSSALMHIKEMMNTATRDFDIDGYKEKFSYLNEDIKPIFESTNPVTVRNHVMNWFNEYGSYIKFITRLSGLSSTLQRTVLFDNVAC